MKAVPADTVLFGSFDRSCCDESPLAVGLQDCRLILPKAPWLDSGVLEHVATGLGRLASGVNDIDLTLPPGVVWTVVAFEASLYLKYGDQPSRKDTQTLVI
jgi:hypothetical protein